jgi:LemA protein
MPMLVTLAVVLAAVVALAAIYNGLVGLRNRAAAAWSDIAVQLVRRHDLVGNLVETVKGYVHHERETLEQVVEARRVAMQAAGTGGPREAGPAEGALGAQVRSLIAVAEGYPDLKASASFLELQRSLVALEDSIQAARRYYNAVVRDFNTRVQSVPDTLVARWFGFRERDYFELSDPRDAAVPKVSLQES